MNRNSSKAHISRIKSDYMKEQYLLQEESQRRKRGLMRRLTVFTVAIIIFIGFTGYTLHEQKEIMQEQRAENSRLEAQLQVLEKEEVELVDEVELLHDPEYIAEIARRDFYLTKPGETLFQLPRSSSD